MNGDKLEPSPKIIKPPNKTKAISTGKSQYFFLTTINSKNSLIKLIYNYCSILFFLMMKLIFFFTNKYKKPAFAAKAIKNHD